MSSLLPWLLEQSEKHPRLDIAAALKSQAEPFAQELAQLFARIDELLQAPARVLVAIDGNSAAGKSSLAALLHNVYDCNVFHMDDFFLPAPLKTKERLGEPGGNVQYERILKEVLHQLDQGSTFSYHPFSCSRQALGEEVSVSPRQLNIVEGAYSLHPALAGYYGLKVFMAVPQTEQSRRILARNGAAMHQRFINEWIPLENHYFQALNIKEQCDLVLNG